MSESGWSGKTFGGRYQIQELIGRGGMSSVYKAYDPNLRRVVAVKLIHPHLSQDPQFVRRFEEEATAVAQLRHPNIIQIHDFDHDGDNYYIVFEFIPGESLKARLERTIAANRQLKLSEITQTTAAVADALDYAHARGLIHRDVKPANVMINVHGQAILMDFGIVKIMGGDTHTATGAVIGTARYISPEQVRGESVDHRTDIYSLGVMLYEMASGRPPFDADSAITIIMMHVNDPVPDIRASRADMPSSLAAVINRAMAKDRNERYQSASELAAALREVKPAPVYAAPVAAAASEAARPVQDSYAKGQSEPPPGGRKPAEKTRGSNRRIVILGALGAAFLLLLCVGAAAIVIGSGIIGGADGGTESAEESAPGATNATGEAEAEGGGQTALELTAAADAAVAVVDNLETTDSATQPTPEFTGTAASTPIMEPTSTASGAIEPTLRPSPTVQATDTAQPTEAPSPTLIASATLEPTALATEPTAATVRIDSISLENDRYVVYYTALGYTPQLPGDHIHFFFNTIPPENAGVGPTQETWYLYGGPNPFTGYGPGDRPAGATQMCSLVANPDHTIRLNTGSCFDLP